MTSPLIDDLNTYANLAFFQAYMDDSLRGVGLDNFDADTQAKALITGTRLLQKQQWSGLPTGLSTVRSVTVSAGGATYSVGDLLTFVGGTTDQPAVVKVLTVASGAVATVQLIEAGLYSALPTSPVVTTTGGSGTGCTLNFTSGGQVLAFPRTSLVDVDGQPVSSTVVPQQVEFALCELAFELLSNSDLETAGGTGSNIQHLGAGSAQINYFHPTDRPGQAPRFPPVVQELLAPFLGADVSLVISSGTDVESSFDSTDEFSLLQGYP